jgi:hypothetical protein
MTTTVTPAAEIIGRELNLDPATAELFALLDEVDDGEDIAKALEAAILALVDIGELDPNRPSVANADKLIRRTMQRIRTILEDSVEAQGNAGEE